MQPGRIENADRVLGAPENWDREKFGPCGGLPIRQERSAGGLPMQASVWIPTPEEIVAIVAGAPVKLWLAVTPDNHPVVSLGAGNVPE